jgi:starch phosphorylase
MGKDLDTLLQNEPDMGLGNGGLGRLAACFMDSLSTVNLPAIGYGIHYEFGLFRQEFINGKQVEHPDAWMRDGSPWKIARPSYRQRVQIYGRVVQKFDDYGHPHYEWVDTKCLLGLPWDIPIVGYDSHTVNVLRLWQAQADEDFNFQVFNEGSYIEALREKAIAETVSKVLYPNDATESGKELRLVQQYFFVACSLADIVRRFKNGYTLPWSEFPAKAAIQLNDTHPAVAIPELMRILVDEEKLPWSQAWKICQETFSYTNHTLKLWRCGPLVFLSASCHAIFRSFTRSISNSSMVMSRPNGPATLKRNAYCHSSKNAAASTCAWHICQSSEDTPRMALPRCTHVCFVSGSSPSFSSFIQIVS